MDSRARFLATLNRLQVDRPACWLGLPDPKALTGLFAHFRVDSLEALKRVIDDDVYAFSLPYDAPGSPAIEQALRFTKDSGPVANEERTLTKPGVFEDATVPADFDAFDWPDPSRYVSPSRCREAVERAPAGKAVLGVLWSAHFQDACAAFGMETALVTLLTDPELFLDLNRRIVDFYLKANAILYEAAGEGIDAVLIGNDYGSQQGLMVSPALLREFVLPQTKRLVDQAHAHGLKVIHHSCGAVAELIPDLIAIGVDAVHPIQARARGMEPEVLRDRFGSAVSFCGGVDAQYLMVQGTPDEVRRSVRHLVSVFPTGLVISPSHEAILIDTRPENVAALFDAVKE